MINKNRIIEKNAYVLKRQPDNQIMPIIAAAIAGVWLLSSLIVLILLHRAPTGYQDKTGFHLGEAPLGTSPSEGDLVHSYYQSKTSPMACPVNLVMFGRGCFSYGFHH